MMEVILGGISTFTEIILERYSDHCGSYFRGI